MKKSIKKFWGVVLVVVMLSTLLVMTTPAAAADPLAWQYKVDQPSGLFFGLAPGTNVIDYAVSGMTMYAVTGAVPGGLPPRLPQPSYRVLLAELCGRISPRK